MTAAFLNPLFSLAICVGVFACAPKPNISAQEQFLENLKTHCGKAYAGQLVSTDASDKDMAAQPMTMQVNCSDQVIRIPFSVGDNRSRTWVISTTGTGLRLKHQHNHQDGTEDTLSQYGGDTVGNGTATRQDFPVDAFTKELFLTAGINTSINNVWSVEITPKIYAYEMNRENRHFRVEFDLTKEIPAPQKPW